jgi:hypothetical protein
VFTETSLPEKDIIDLELSAPSIISYVISSVDFFNSGAIDGLFSYEASSLAFSSSPFLNISLLTSVPALFFLYSASASLIDSAMNASPSSSSTSSNAINSLSLF